MSTNYIPLHFRSTCGWNGNLNNYKSELIRSWLNNLCRSSHGLLRAIRGFHLIMLHHCIYNASVQLHCRSLLHWITSFSSAPFLHTICTGHGVVWVVLVKSQNEMEMVLVIRIPLSCPSPLLLIWLTEWRIVQEHIPMDWHPGSSIVAKALGSCGAFGTIIIIIFPFIRPFGASPTNLVCQNDTTAYNSLPSLDITYPLIQG